MKIYPTENHLKFGFESKGVDIDSVINKANQSINLVPQIVDAEKYYNVDSDYDLEEGEGAKLFILDHNTTQGVVIGRENADVMQIVIPALSSEADIAYAFHLLRALTELYPDLSIKKSDAISDFSEKGVAEAIAHCRNNMRIYLTAEVDEEDFEWSSSIRGYSMGTTITIDMLKRQYSLPDDYQDIDHLVELAFGIFTRLQWMATALPHADHSKMPARYLVYDDLEDFDDDEDYDFSDDVVIIHNSNLFVNVAWCEIVLAVNGRYKSVTPTDFYTAALRNDHIEVLTDEKYVISEVPPQEWEEFCQSIPGNLFDGPRTFILRWNPAISTFTRKRYNHYLSKYGEFGISWAIHDWEQARKDDRCYMLLEGGDEEHPGIIFKGEFRCDPYTDRDWRGTDKELHYVDAECSHMANIDKRAWITMQQLEAAIPDFDWRHGHSGEQLTVEQAEILEKLWGAAMTPYNQEE